MPTQQLTTSHTIPIQGGIDEVHEKPNKTPIAFLNDRIQVSMPQSQNMRPKRNGMRQRGGCTKHSTTTEHSTKEITSLYGFSKGKRSELALFAQYDNGSVDKGTDNPFDNRGVITAFADAGGGKVTVTSNGHGLSNAEVVTHADTINYSGAFAVSNVAANTYEITATWVADDATGIWIETPTVGNFGTSVLAARSGASPASWANFQDYLLYADGAGQAQIYTGEQQIPRVVNVYKGSSAIPDVPQEGADYTKEATDGIASTVVELDSLDTFANHDALFIGFDTPVNKITITMLAGNDNASVSTLSYRKDDSTWTDTSASDGTDVAGDTFKQTGSFTWTLPTDEIPHYSFSKNTFLYRITLSAALDAEVEISSITGENTAGFQTVQNVWDGRLIPAIEAIVQDVSPTPDAYSNYSSQSIKPGEMASGDYLYVNSLDPLAGFYLNVGKTPNTTASTTINEVACWTGASFVAMSTLKEGTNGGANSGYVTWARNTSVRKLNFNSSQYYSYWYRISLDKALSPNLTWAVMTMPYFDINDLNPNLPVVTSTAQTVTSWDRRVWYSFDDNQLHGTAKLSPMTLNGDDYVGGSSSKNVFVGDHRSNKIICTRRFYNFLLVWQEEKGKEGGCFSIVEPGETSAKYDSQIVSPTLGILNSKCAVVLEDVNMSDINKEIPTMTGVFFVSRVGIQKSNGDFVKDISGGIANYFDPSKAECIRRGYEDKHFLEWDSLYKVIRLGLVSGSSATEPNKFFVLDPVTNAWTEDVLGQNISSLTEIEAASGNTIMLQYAGCQDGFVRRVNTSNHDDGSDITSNIVLGLNGRGHKFLLDEETVRCKAQSSGEITRTIASDGNTTFEDTQTLEMTVDETGDTYRAHRYPSGRLEGSHFEIKFENTTSGVPMELEDFGCTIEEVLNNTVN